MSNYSNLHQKLQATAIIIKEARNDSLITEINNNKDGIHDLQHGMAINLISTLMNENDLFIEFELNRNINETNLADIINLIIPNNINITLKELYTQMQDSFIKCNMKGYVGPLKNEIYNPEQIINGFLYLNKPGLELSLYFGRNYCEMSDDAILILNNYKEKFIINLLHKINNDPYINLSSYATASELQIVVSKTVINMYYDDCNLFGENDSINTTNTQDLENYCKEYLKYMIIKECVWLLSESLKQPPHIYITFPITSNELLISEILYSSSKYKFSVETPVYPIATNYNMTLISNRISNGSHIVVNIEYKNEENNIIEQTTQNKEIRKIHINITNSDNDIILDQELCPVKNEFLQWENNFTNAYNITFDEIKNNSSNRLVLPFTDIVFVQN